MNKNLQLRLDTYDGNKLNFNEFIKLTTNDMDLFTNEQLSKMLERLFINTNIISLAIRIQELGPVLRRLSGYRQILINTTQKNNIGIGRVLKETLELRNVISKADEKAYLLKTNNSGEHLTKECLYEVNNMSFTVDNNYKGFINLLSDVKVLSTDNYVYSIVDNMYGLKSYNRRPISDGEILYNENAWPDTPKELLLDLLNGINFKRTPVTKLGGHNSISLEEIGSLAKIFR